MIAAARANNVFFMEALWSRFLPSIVALREELSKGSIGQIQHVHAEFGIRPSPMPARLSDLEIGGGSLLDLGIYVVSLTSMVLGGKPPVRIQGLGSKNENGVDEKAHFTLEYPGNVFAQLACSIVLKMSNTLTVYGEKGYLRLLAPFHAPDKLESDTGVKGFPFPSSESTYNFQNSVALSFEAAHCRECIIQGMTESPIMPLEESLNVSNILDEVRKQIGVRYPQDI